MVVVILLLCKCSGEWFNNIGLDGLSVVGLRNWCRILRFESVCVCVWCAVIGEEEFRRCAHDNRAATVMFMRECVDNSQYTTDQPNHIKQ